MSILSVGLFVMFVAIVLALSFFFASRAKSASGYYAAGSRIHWGVNGIAFAGDYLSAASFLGICGMIATAGYDGFLYSIGYLAGWIVALFVVAEPIKRLGKYTFTDALDAKFNHKGHQAHRGDQHAGRLAVLPHPADGRRRRPGDAAAGPAALRGRPHGRRHRHHDRRHRGHDLDDLRAVHQGGAAHRVLHGARRRPVHPRPLHDARPGRQGPLPPVPHAAGQPLGKRAAWWTSRAGRWRR